MSTTLPKKGADQSYATLPFPHPMATTEGHVVWPFARNAFPLFLAKIDSEQKWVEVSDSNAIKALQCMGFFGFYTKTRFMANDTHKNYIESSQDFEDSEETKVSQENSKSSKDSRLSDGKYILESTCVVKALEVEQSMSEPKQTVSEVAVSDDTLKLSFLEAFFISYVFGSLNVCDPKANHSQRYMTIEQMWQTLGRHYSEDKLEFAAHYSAYHYLRSKGWVVRNGHSFGVDYLLYNEGPHLYHAQYSVLVRYSVEDSYNKPLDWLHISALIRLSKNVRKVSKKYMLTELLIEFFQRN